MQNETTNTQSEELGISAESLENQGIEQVPQSEDAQGPQECSQENEQIAANDGLENPTESQELVGAETEGEKKGKEKPFEIHISEPVKINEFEDVKQVVLDHAGWIDSVINPRAAIRAGRANFKGNDLSGMNLAGVDLRGATFSHTICRGTVFSGANLSGANFSHADLSGADFRGAKLRRANFDHSVLVGADWDDAILTNASFRYAHRDDDSNVVQENLSDDEVQESLSDDEVQESLSDDEVQEKAELQDSANVQSPDIESDAATPEVDGKEILTSKESHEKDFESDEVESIPVESTSEEPLSQ